MRDAGLQRILLVAPTTSDARLAQAIAAAEAEKQAQTADGTGETNQPITAELGTPTNLPPEPEQQPEQQPQDDSANLSAMTVEKLKALAAERGIELPAKALKAEIIELLSK